MTNAEPPKPAALSRPGPVIAGLGLAALAIAAAVTCGRAECELRRAKDLASTPAETCPEGTKRYANQCMTEDEISKKHLEERRAATATPAPRPRPPARDDAEQLMRDIENKVARDSVEQYEIAKRQGDPMMVCVQAGMVSAAWLQAKNEAEYKKWKDIEKDDCKKAGL